MSIGKEEIDKVLSKYSKKLNKEVVSEDAVNYKPNTEFSKEYQIFKEEFLSKKLNWYERSCKSTYRILKVKANPKNYPKVEKNIKMAHLDINPHEAASFAMVMVVSLIIVSLVIGSFSLLFGAPLSVLFFAILLILASFLLINPLSSLPVYLGNNYRLKASNQMVLFILYMVIYMRHTPNMEHALKFAADHIGQPLSLDIRKVFYDVELGKYSTLKESLDSYLSQWKDYNLDFVNSIHLLESSLYESNEERRLTLLDKSLDNMLSSSYDKMLSYAHDLKNPITMIHMLGIILPILGLVILPLATSFLSNVSISSKIVTLILLYNILIPGLVFISGKYVLSKRSTGYGETQLDFKLDKKKFLPFFIATLLILIGLIPLIIHFINPGFDIQVPGLGKLLDYYGNLGPFGAVSVIFGLMIPLGIGLGFGIKNKLSIGEAAKKRDELKKLELEFSSSLFQLGNRIGEGMPPEKAFGNVSEVLAGTPTGSFFGKINHNLKNLGMSLQDAIFGREHGAIKDYPSPLVESSMEVLIQGSKKGPKIVSESLISMSNYSRNVHKVNERLKDLLSDVLASMKSQIGFLAPVIAGIVVGIATMIVNIMGNLKFLTEQIGDNQDFSAYASLGDFFNITSAIPSYYFQLIIGIYMVQIIVILSILINNLEFGFDKVNEKRLIGNSLTRGMLLYSVIAAVVTLLFTLLANVILGGFTGFQF